MACRAIESTVGSREVVEQGTGTGQRSVRVGEDVAKQLGRPIFTLARRGTWTGLDHFRHPFHRSGTPIRSNAGAPRPQRR